MGSIERRKQIRYQMTDWVFVMLYPSCQILGRVIDMSLGGLSFHYVPTERDREYPLRGALEWTIFGTKFPLILERVPFKIVYDEPYQAPGLKVISRRHGVEFGGMSETARTQLKIFMGCYSE